jgi:glucosamine kinase
MGEGAAFLLGVDGGGTGCRAVLAAAAGRVLGEGAAGPANIVSDPDGALASVLEAAAAAISGHCRPQAVTAVLGLAGANLPAAAAAFAARLPFGRAKVVPDAEIAVAGALGAADGIVAITGTGSVFCRQRDGRIDGIGGWGLVLGDEGSGAWLGRAACARALRGADGRSPLTAFLRGVLDRHGGAAGLVAFARNARPADFAALVPDLLAAAEAGDGAAAAVLAEGAAEVDAAIAHLQAGAGLPEVLPVVFLGGLGPVYAARAAGRWPVAAPRGGPLDGALRRARGIAMPGTPAAPAG